MIMPTLSVRAVAVITPDALQQVAPLLSAHAGLFGLKESLNVPYAMLSLWVEFAGAAILLVAAVLLAVAPRTAQARGKRGNPSRTPSRT